MKKMKTKDKIKKTIKICLFLHQFLTLKKENSLAVISHLLLQLELKEEQFKIDNIIKLIFAQLDKENQSYIPTKLQQLPRTLYFPLFLFFSLSLSLLQHYSDYDGGILRSFFSVFQLNAYDDMLQVSSYLSLALSTTTIFASSSSSLGDVARTRRVARGEAKQVLSFEEDESGRLRLEITLLRLHHQELDIFAVAARERLGDEARHVLMLDTFDTRPIHFED